MISQLRAAHMLGVTQPTVNEALKKGRLKSLAIEDIAEYRSRIKAKNNYWTVRTEVEQERHEELIDVLKGLSRRLDMLTAAVTALTVKEVMK